MPPSFSFGVAGDIAAGKSTLLALLRERLAAAGHALTPVDGDRLRRRFLANAEDPDRRRAELLLRRTDDPPDPLSGTVLNERLIAAGACPARTAIGNGLRREAAAIAANATETALEWTLLAEDGLLDLCRSRLILVAAPVATRRARLRAQTGPSALPPTAIEARIALQRRLRWPAAQLPRGTELLCHDGRTRPGDPAFEATVQSVLRWLNPDVRS